MTYKGFVKTGKGIDSKRNNWEEIKNNFEFKPFKGTLNVFLNKEFSTSDFPCDFKIFDKFRFTRGLLKANSKEKKVYIGFKDNVPIVKMFFIVSDVKLRDELKLEDGDKVEVTL